MGALAAAWACCIAAPACAHDVPGLMYERPSWLVFLAPEKPAASAPVRAVVILQKACGDGRQDRHPLRHRAKSEPRASCGDASKNAMTKVAVDFDSGRELGYWSDFKPGAPVQLADGGRGIVTECSIECVYEMPWPGAIGDRRLKLESNEMELSFPGGDERLENYVHAPDPRAANGYTAVRAVASDSTVLWDKSYLVDTRGELTSARGDVVTTNLVETPSRVHFQFPGDGVAYVWNESSSELQFGDVLFRIDLRTGQLTGEDPRVKAVDTSEVKSVLDQAIAEVMRRDVGPPKEATEDGFHWTGNSNRDLPARLDYVLHRKFFNGH